MTTLPSNFLRKSANTYKERHLRIHDEQRAWGSGIFVLQLWPRRMLDAMEWGILRRGRTD